MTNSLVFKRHFRFRPGPTAPTPIYTEIPPPATPPLLCPLSLSLKTTFSIIIYLYLQLTNRNKAWLHNSGAMRRSRGTRLHSTRWLRPLNETAWSARIFRPVTPSLFVAVCQNGNFAKEARFMRGRRWVERDFVQGKLGESRLGFSVPLAQGTPCFLS